jgi:hypothetical protein
MSARDAFQTAEHRGVRLAICALVLGGCHSDVRAVTSDLGNRSTTGPPLAVFEERGISVQLESPQWNAECRRTLKTCRAVLMLTIENRSAVDQVVIEGIELAENTNTPFSFATAFHTTRATLPKGSSLVHRLSDIKDTEHELTLRVVVTFGAAAPVRLSSPPWLLPNEARSAAKEQCKSSRGKWVEDARGTPYCSARSRDSGKTCRDGMDCEWLCIFDRYELTGAPDSKPALGRPIGHCSAFVGEPGCFVYVEPNASSKPPSDIHVPPPRRCFD